MEAKEEHYVRVRFTAAGTVEEWTPTKIETTKELLAIVGGVDPATATLTVESGSVKLTFRAQTSTEDEAVQAQHKLESVLGSAVEATDALVNATIFVVDIPQVDVPTIRTVDPKPSPPTPPAPPQAPSPSPPGKERVVKRDQGIVLGIVAISLGSFAGLVVVVMLIVFRRRVLKELSKATGVISTASV